MSEQENTSMALIDGANLAKVTEQLTAIANFQSVIQNNLKSNQDYGVIPGTGKPTLLKPGAEKIQMLFGVTSEYEEIERVQDYEKGFFAYTIKCTLSKNGQKITEGLGHCNSREKKYIKQDPYSIANTCLKMAKKRAQIDATLTIASLSEVFTQDIEDLQDYDKKEKMETMQFGDAQKIKVTFGKNKGKTLGEIVKDDKSYIQWLAKNGKDAVMRQACEMLLNGPHEAPKQSTTQPATPAPKDVTASADITEEPPIEDKIDPVVEQLQNLIQINADKIAEAMHVDKATVLKNAMNNVGLEGDSKGWTEMTVESANKVIKELDKLLKPAPQTA